VVRARGLSPNLGRSDCLRYSPLDASATKLGLVLLPAATLQLTDTVAVGNEIVAETESETLCARAVSACQSNQSGKWGMLLADPQMANERVFWRWPRIMLLCYSSAGSSELVYDRVEQQQHPR